MESLSIGLRLIFKPETLKPHEENEPNLTLLNVGWKLGLIGFILMSIYIFPSDEINFGDFGNAQSSIILNKFIGGIFGIVLFLLLFVFEKLMMLILGMVKVKDFNKQDKNKINELHKGSLSVFFLMPFTNIPIHAIFNDELSLRGNSWIVFALIILYLSWHVITFLILLDNFLNKSENNKNMKTKLALFLFIELFCAFLFLLLIPNAFGVDLSRVMEEYF